MIKNNLTGSGHNKLQSSWLAFAMTLIGKLLGCCLGSAIATSVSYYLLFGFDKEVDTNALSDQPPTRSQSFKHHINHLEGWNEGICIVCRDQPIGAIQIKPCGHVVCEECAQAWFLRAHNRCPYCNRVLFVERSRQLEIAPKVLVASAHFILTLNTVQLFGGQDPGSRTAMTLSWLVSTVLLLNFTEQKRKWGTRWWMHFMEGQDEDSQITIAICFILSAVSICFGG